MSGRLPRFVALGKEDRIDEMKNKQKQQKKKNNQPVPHLLQAQQAPALPYTKEVGRPPRHWKLPNTIARHENGYSSLNKIILISCRKHVFNCQFHPFILILSKFLCFKNEISHFLNIGRTEISPTFAKHFQNITSLH